MGSKQKSREPPKYAYYDNPVSSFGMVYADLLRCKQYQRLHPAAKALYTVCMAHAATKESQTCLYERLNSINAVFGNWTEFDIKQMCRNNRSGLFVFPEKQYQKYGYTHGSFNKYMKELIENGFVRRKYSGKNQHEVTVYEFDSKFKSFSVTP